MPQRLFDPSIPLKRRNRPHPETEDEELTAFLTPIVEEILSTDETPPAECPKCGGRKIYCVRRRGAVRDSVPVFGCGFCNRQFRRTTGTPLSKIVRREQVVPFVRLLSQQQPFAYASEQLGIDYRIALAWTAKFREWLLELDPSGYMEAKVRLGIMPDLSPLACPSCAKTGSMMHSGFTRLERRRKLCCGDCGAFFLVGDDAVIALTSDKVRGDRAEVLAQSSTPVVTPIKRRCDIAEIEPEIIAMVEAGNTHAAAARRFGIDPQTVTQVMRHRQAVLSGRAIGARKTKRGIVSNMTQAHKDDIRNRRGEGETLASLASTYGISIGSIYKVLAEQ